MTAYSLWNHLLHLSTKQMELVFYPTLTDRHSKAHPVFFIAFALILFRAIERTLGSGPGNSYFGSLHATMLGTNWVNRPSTCDFGWPRGGSIPSYSPCPCISIGYKEPRSTSNLTDEAIEVKQLAQGCKQTCQ